MTAAYRFNRTHVSNLKHHEEELATQFYNPRSIQFLCKCTTYTHVKMATEHNC
jgi:hypothetical protein